MSTSSMPTPEQLLEHTEWLLRLARALVGDATAPDVVQETYEVALARPPHHGGPLRPWLGGVARNIARMTTRGRVRRERREHAVPLAAPVPTPEELVERVEMHQRVARIVLELPEPLRSTLLLRYVEGMSAAEIAHTNGIPAATVRSRLKNALDRVRATLDDRHGGDRRRWIAVIAPLPVARYGMTTFTKGLLVKTALKLVVAIAIALIVVFGTRWLGWWGAGQSDAARSLVVATATETSKRPAAVALPAVAQVSLRRGPATHDDDPAGSLRFEGQVIDEHDHPVAGAHVAIDANPPVVVDTEVDGSFLFDKLIPRDYQIEATAGDGYAGPARLRLGARVEPVTLRMRRGGAMDIVVTAVTGKPIAGASVELRSTLTWRSTSDAVGLARLRGVGDVWAPLAVTATGFAPSAQMVWASGSPAAPQRVVVTLAAGAVIAGRVIDDTGKPIAGARVVPTSASEPFPVVDARRDGVVSGANGAFTFAAVAAGTWRLTAMYGDHGPATSLPLTVDGVHPRSGVELALAAGGVVRGVVRDRAGKPVDAADVRVVVRGNVSWRARRQAFTGADGAFEITGLPRRAVDIVASHDSGASAIAAVDLAANREREVALSLDVIGAITGVVVDRNGAPLGDAPVTAEPAWSGGLAEREAWGVRGDQETVTDQGGGFRFTGLPDGAYHIRAARPGAPDRARSLATPVTVRPGGGSLRIVVPADGQVIGKVAFADGKVPAQFRIALASTYPTPFASADGAFALPAAAGNHVLVVTGPGFVEKRVQDVAITEGKDTDLGTITIAAGRSVSGRVIDETGAPVTHAKVAAGALLSGGGGNELYIANESRGAKDTESDDAGQFALDGFSQGAIIVVAGKDGVGRSPSIRLPPGPDSARLDLVVQRTTGVDGKVTRGGQPVADTVVIANPVGATSSNFFVTTGADGTFALDALAAGTYIVYPMIGGGGGGRPKNVYARTVEVGLGTRAHVEIDATPGPITLQLTVNNADGSPVAMAQVVAIEAQVKPTSFDDLRDGARFPEMADHVVPLYLRNAMGGTAELQGMRAGAHTVCAVAMSMPPPEDMNALPMTCAPIKLDVATPRAKLELMLPVKP